MVTLVFSAAVHQLPVWASPVDQESTCWTGSHPKVFAQVWKTCTHTHTHTHTHTELMMNPRGRELTPPTRLRCQRWTTRASWSPGCRRCGSAADRAADTHQCPQPQNHNIGIPLTCFSHLGGTLQNHEGSTWNQNDSSEWRHKRTISGSSKNLSNQSSLRNHFLKEFFKEPIKVSQRTFNKWFFKASYMVPQRTFQTRVL